MQLMSSYRQQVMRISALELAVLEDSGWYTANYSAADGLLPFADYGFQQGCDFATQKCLTTVSGSLVGQGSPPHFYGDTRDSGTGTAACTTDRVSVGYVQIGTYSSSLPSQYQYFASLPKQGGSLQEADFCPLIQPYSNRQCTNPSDAYGQAALFGETYGSGSMCLYSTLLHAGYGGQTNGAGCFTASCDSSSQMSITFPAGQGGSSTVTVACGAADAGTTKSVSGYNGGFICPDPSVVCAPLVWINPTAPTPSPSATPSTTSSPLPSPSASTGQTPTASPSLSATPSVTPSISATPSASPATPADGSTVPPDVSGASAIAAAQDTVTLGLAIFGAFILSLLPPAMRTAW